jgi:hypothetical protein
MAGGSQGVFYVATEQVRFVVEACRSAESLRRWVPDVHITLFADEPRIAGATAGPFDAVEVLPVAEGLGTSWGSGLLGKVRAFCRSPYETSLYLDTDTRVLGPRIRELFEALRTYEVAIAACEPGESRNQALSARPMFNSGVVGFRNTANVRRLLRAWRERQEAHARAILDGDPDRFEYIRQVPGPYKLFQLVADQTALARYLAPDVNEFQVTCLTLPRTWNWRSNHIDDAHAGKVVIHHAPRFKVDFLPEGPC